MTEASFVPDISHTVTDFPFSSPAPWRRKAPGEVRESKDSRAAPSAALSRRPPSGAPRLGRALGSETPRPIIPHIISLSQEQQIPINLRSKLFPILDQATSVCVGEGRTNGPHPAPFCSSSSIPSHRSWDGPDPIPPPSSRHPAVWLTVSSLHPSKQSPPTESENWGPGRVEGVGTEMVRECFSWETTTSNAPILHSALHLSAHLLSHAPYS